MPDTANLATICTDSENGHGVFGEGLDFLPMPGHILEAEVREPSALRLLKFRLLQRLKAQVWSKSQAECGNQSSPELVMRNTDLESSFRTTSYREKHSVLDWTVDLMSGSWIQVVKGTLAFVACHGSWSEEAQDQLCNTEGKRFTPDQKDVQVVYLEPGDTFIIRPGTQQPTVYCSVTLEDTLTTGGALWPEEPQRLLNTLRHMDFMICHRRKRTKPKPRAKTDVLQDSVLDVDTPKQLPEYLEVLRGYIGLERRWFQGRTERKEAYSESLEEACQTLSSVGATSFLDHRMFDEETREKISAIIDGTSGKKGWTRSDPAKPWLSPAIARGRFGVAQRKNRSRSSRRAGGSVAAGDVKRVTWTA
ncbi:hypothetical protein E8E12_001385 [Didymella heteroderae]|uniref:Uncharacterized protein n=1 Tax=Didymella heteroderae TaxID=1769908 RepID=A0A9P4WG05_9PLEO|nr:hypothetical protein E8E12_001385 [Didymella heteroderae]